MCLLVGQLTIKLFSIVGFHDLLAISMMQLRLIRFTASVICCWPFVGVELFPFL